MIRDVLGPARLRLQGGNVADEFGRRFGPAAMAKVVAGEVFSADGVVLDARTEMPAGSFVYHYRDLPDEVVVPFDVPVLYRADRISRRPRWCGCAASSICPNSARRIDWTG